MFRRSWVKANTADLAEPRPRIPRLSSEAGGGRRGIRGRCRWGSELECRRDASFLRLRFARAPHLRLWHRSHRRAEIDRPGHPGRRRAGSTTSKIPQEQAQESCPSGRPTPRQQPAPDDSAMAAGVAPSSLMDDAADTPDPLKGQFTLAQAAIGLPDKGPFEAKIKTTRGELRCKLFDDKAPVATANFVGLARGVRPFKDRGKWITRPAYDGTLFHRVIKGFMIQGGDPLGTGRGEPGYVFKDELWPGGKHDRPGPALHGEPRARHERHAVLHHRRGRAAPRSLVHDLRRVRARPDRARDRAGRGRWAGSTGKRRGDREGRDLA